MGGFLSPVTQATSPPSHMLIVKQYLQIVYKIINVKKKNAVNNKTIKVY